MSKKQKIEKTIIKFGNSSAITISNEILGNNLVAPIGHALKVTITPEGVVSFKLPLKNDFYNKKEE